MEKYKIDMNITVTVYTDNKERAEKIAGDVIEELKDNYDDVSGEVNYIEEVM